MSISSMLDRSLTIQRAVVSKSPAGAAQRAFGTIAADVMFCVAPASDRLTEYYGRRNMVVDYVLYTNADLPSLIAGDANHRAGVSLNDVVTDPDKSENFVVRGRKYYSNAQVSSETLWELHCQMQDNPVP